MPFLPHSWQLVGLSLPATCVRLRGAVSHRRRKAHLQLHDHSSQLPSPQHSHSSGAAGTFGALQSNDIHRTVVTTRFLSLCSQGKILLSLLNYASFAFITKYNLKQLLGRWVKTFFKRSSRVQAQHFWSHFCAKLWRLAMLRDDSIGEQCPVSA